MIRRFKTDAGAHEAAEIGNERPVPDGVAEDLGVALGQEATVRMLALRANDNSTMVVPYSPGGDPGEWRPTRPAFRPALLPQWPLVTPFAMPGANAFRPPPPPALATAEYAADVEEVRRLGEYFDTERTEEQTDIALFWADETGTSTPPGHWNRIAATVVRERGLGTAKSAHVFALLNIAEADAGIASWEAKYHYEYWRPITAINLASTDDNDATIEDKAWTPRLTTPPFPEYPSGHSTFSGAGETVLTTLFGDVVAFTDSSEGLPDNHGRPDFERSFGSFAEAAEEAGRSRIYGGIHFHSANAGGKASGRALGAFVMETQLLPRGGDWWGLR